MKKNNRNIKEIIQSTFEPGVEMLAEMVGDTLVGQVAPGVVAARLAYKQKRSEVRFIEAISEIKNKQQDLQDKLEKLDVDQQEFVKSTALPLIFDAILEEQQSEKIKYFINALESTIEYKVLDEDLILTYTDTLKGLRNNEIDFFIANYVTPSREYDISKLIDQLEDRRENKGKFDQIKGVEQYMINKLTQLGLVESTLLKESTIDANENVEIKLTPFAQQIIKYFRLKK